MRELENEIISYLISQTGVLRSMMRSYSSLGRKIVTWLTGEKPVLIIGGEPANGKSLLIGELVLRLDEIAKLYPVFQSPPAIISYDRVHYLFLKYLMMTGIDSAYNFLPEGETHPKARKYVTKILRDVLLFAIFHLPQNTPIILETSLIDHRGEYIVDELSAWGFPIQVFIIHSPTMQSRVLQQEKQRTKATSAQSLTIRKIHEALLQQRGITSLSKQVQDNELIKSWEQWLGNCDGLVLTWDPADDEAGFLHIKEVLKAKNISPDPLTPLVLNKYTTFLIKVVLELIPNLEMFAIEVKRYQP